MAWLTDSARNDLNVLKGRKTEIKPKPSEAVWSGSTLFVQTSVRKLRIFTVITLKCKQCVFTIQQCVQMMSTEGKQGIPSKSSLIGVCTVHADLSAPVTPGKRSTCTPLVYYRKSIWLVTVCHLTCVTKHVAKRVSMFNVSLLFCFNYCWKSKKVICCGNKYW